MAKDNQKYESLATGILAAAIAAALASCYHEAAPLLAAHGLANEYVDMAVLIFHDVLKDRLAVKLFILIMCVCQGAFRLGGGTEKGWGETTAWAAGGTLLTLLCPSNAVLYTLTTLAGLATATYGYSLVFRHLRGGVPEAGEDEGFDQTEQLMETGDSINIPYTFRRKGRNRRGWINCINPFRASMVLGSPGSGKSFAIYNAFIEQTIRKGYTMFLYDYKFPDLTERVLTEIAYQTRHEGLWKDMEKKPVLCIINFDDPLKSNRCNPIHHSYITDPADTTEIADLVFKNINRGNNEKGFDFFNESAKVYLDALTWFLANYDPDAVFNDPEGLEWYKQNRGEEAYMQLPESVRVNPDWKTVIDSRSGYRRKGCYCTFPHLIEVMAYDYRKVFNILQNTKGLEAKLSPFSGALEGGAMEQLQGQMASAQIPLGRFSSPALYWVMTGDDFTLDFNNPEEPKIICMGNNPDRQEIYGTTLALYTSRMFKLINHKHKLKSAVLLDEVPTIFIKGLDNLIATARSNKVAIVLGAQDKSQLRRDYGEKESEVIMTTVGNVFSGSVEGRTAEDLSKTFGKEWRQRESVSRGDDSTSTTTSLQQEDIMPASRITDMTQGEFCGWVKDNFGMEISHKKFHGRITVDGDRNRKLEKEAAAVPFITDMLGDSARQMTDSDRDRLSALNPRARGDGKSLQALFEKEKVQERINGNFRQVKQETAALIESENDRVKKIIAQFGGKPFDE